MRAVYLENTTDGSNKYYAVYDAPDGVRASWGRIATAHGETPADKLTNIYASTMRRSAGETFEGLVKAKERRGYKRIAETDSFTVDASTGATGMSGGARSVLDKVKSASMRDAMTPAAPVEPPKPVLREVTLATCTESKDFVPHEEWYLDGGHLKAIATGIMLNIPVLLKGDTGCGKTSAVRYLAHKTKNGLRRVNLNGSTTVDEFVGKWVVESGSMVWKDGVLIDAMRKGHWIVMDEINACLPEIAFVLHSLLDDDRMVVLTQKDGEVVKPHADFRVFATMNPDYAGTHVLNQAFEDRFPVVVQMGYPVEKEELKIVAKKSGNEDMKIMQKMVAVANKARKEYDSEKLLATISTRRLIDWAKLSLYFGPAVAFQFTVLNKCCKEDRVVLRDLAGVIFPDTEFKQVLKI